MVFGSATAKLNWPVSRAIRQADWSCRNAPEPSATPASSSHSTSEVRPIERRRVVPASRIGLHPRSLRLHSRESKNVPGRNVKFSRPLSKDNFIIGKQAPKEGMDFSVFLFTG